MSSFIGRNVNLDFPDLEKTFLGVRDNFERTASSKEEGNKVVL